MVWPFGKKQRGPDFVGALGSVSNWVILEQRDFTVWRDLPRFGVTEEGLVAWVREGNGREVLSLDRWRGLAAAELGELSELARDVVGSEKLPPVEELLVRVENKGKSGTLPLDPSDDYPSDDSGAKKGLQEHLRDPDFERRVQGYFADAQKPVNISARAKKLFEEGGEAFLALDLLGAKNYWIQAIEADSQYSYAYAWLGTVYKYENNPQKSLECCNDAIDRDRGLAYAYKERGIAYQNLKRYEEAITDYTKAIDIDPRFTYAYGGRGNTYHELKRYEEAIEDYNQAIDIDPRFTYAYYGRGNTYNELKRYEEAIKDYNQAIDIDPRYTYAYGGRGNTYRELKRYEEGIADCTRAIELDLNCTYAYINRGSAYRELKRYEEAIRDYTRAITLQPEDWRAWANRGLALFDYSGYQAALDNYTEGLKHIDPDSEPLGCATLHRFTGRAHYQQAKNHSEYMRYWDATQSYSTAYNFIEANPLYTPETLKILRDWIQADRALEQSESADKLTINAIQRLERALQNADPQSRRLLRAEFQDFYRLNVDRLVSQNNPWEALIEAEKWKSLALTWLQNPNADPQPLSRETLQTRIQHLCPNPHTAILYWHLSPAQITTFLLRPHQDPQTFTTPTDPPHTPATKTQTNFTEWLKNYKEQYQQHRKKTPSSHGSAVGWTTGGSAAHNQEAEPPHSHDLAEPSHEETWRDQLPQTLHHLSQILN
ncbi:tetratricopeptide repeat protein, partial [Spirulina sp. CCNP1310]|uniref:tetratricopeptide repeat protein n=1 Tax=Spirulina sp. CCNP1310 TaxID=3110249 RepID=UPI002B21EC72